MQAKQATFQAPRPEVKIYDPKSDKEKLYFSTASKKVLREYSFKTSVDDVRGQFSLTFYPDEYDGSDPIFDQINELDIVRIYEQYYEGSMLATKILPTFTGVVRSIKYASQASGNNVTRKLVVSGHSVAGLVSNFYLNMDANAMAVTKRKRAQENVATLFNECVSYESPPEPKSLKEITDAIWKVFIDIANNRDGEMSNPKIKEMLDKWIGSGPDELFDIDENIFFQYPLGVIFDGKTTKSFFDLIDGLMPSPPYEKFAYTDHSTGKMRIRIRECPFDEDEWNKIKGGELPIKLIKSVNIERNDNEVYTVFFSWLDNSAIGINMALKLQADEEPGPNPTLVIDDDKYKIYGYRPLFVHFKGYGKKEGETDEKTAKNLKELNERLKNWYNDIELMQNGQITMSTDLSADMPQAGEKISFIGGEFYVTAAEHRWSYKGNPETILTVTRGAKYQNGERKKLEYWGRKKTGDSITCQTSI
jgi:hypothetical protein